jgi:hypothetical protein
MGKWNSITKKLWAIQTMSGDLKWRWCSRVIIKIANAKWIILNGYKNRTIPWPKCFFISFAEHFICFPLSKFQKWIDSFHLYIGVRLFLTLIVCDNTVGFRADKCRFRSSNGDKEKTSRNERSAEYATFLLSLDIGDKRNVLFTIKK